LNGFGRALFSPSLFFSAFSAATTSRLIGKGATIIKKKEKETTKQIEKHISMMIF
jgi:hypothetical protein